MAANRQGKTDEVVFEGVLIPKGTRSAKLASKGISTIDEMGDFLTAVFADTLNGKIVLPPPRANRVPRNTRNAVGQLGTGLPVKMQGMELGIKRPRRAKIEASLTQRQP
jgi:hypothetical protein